MVATGRLSLTFDDTECTEVALITARVLLVFIALIRCFFF